MIITTTQGNLYLALETVTNLTKPRSTTNVSHICLLDGCDDHLYSYIYINKYTYIYLKRK